MLEEFFERKEIQENLLVNTNRFSMIETLRIVVLELKVGITLKQFAAILVSIGFVNEDLTPSNNSFNSGYAESNLRPVEIDGKVQFCPLTEFTDKGIKAIIHILIELKMNGALDSLFVMK